MRKSSAIHCIISQYFPVNYPLLGTGQRRIIVTRNFVCGFLQEILGPIFKHIRYILYLKATLLMQVNFALQKTAMKFQQIC